MTGHTEHRRRAGGRRVLALAATLTALAATQAGATYGCTAVYGTTSTGSSGAIGYYNPGLNSYQTLGATLGTRPNAAALNVNTGQVYYVDQGSNVLARFDPNTNQNTSIGRLSRLPNQDLTYSSGLTPAVIGGTFDNAGKLYVLYSASGQSSDGSSRGAVAYAQVDPATGAVSGSYRAVTTSDNSPLYIRSNGDLAFDGNNAALMVAERASEIGTPVLYSLDLSSGVATPRARLSRDSAVLNSTSANGLAYDGGNSSYVNVGPAGAVNLHSLNLSSGVTTSLKTVGDLTDLTGCGARPLSPAVTKTFAPSSILPGETSRLTLTLGNRNDAPYYLTADLTDLLPAGMKLTASPTPDGTCLLTDQSNLTAAASADRLTLLSGTRVPRGGCTLNVTVTATASGTNSLAAGTLKTTAGPSTAAASALLTVRVPVALSVIKSVVGSLSAGSSATYRLSVTNAPGSAPTSGVITLSDHLPALLGAAPASGFMASSGTLTWTCTYADETVNPSGNLSGQLVTCTSSGVLAGGATSSLDLPVTVLPMTVLPTPATSLTNLAAVGGGGDPFNGGVAPVAGSAGCDSAHCASLSSPVAALPAPPATCASGTPTNLLAGPVTRFSDRDDGSDSTALTLVAGAGSYRAGTGPGSAYVIDLDWWFNNGQPNPSRSSQLSLYVNGTEYARAVGNDGLAGQALIGGLNGASVTGGALNRGDYGNRLFAKLNAWVTLPASVTSIGSAELRFTGGTSAGPGPSDDFGFLVRAITACTRPQPSVTGLKTVQNLTQNGAVGSDSSGKPGEVLEYCITVSNVGVVGASNVSIGDTLPLSVTALPGERPGGYGLAGQDVRVTLTPAGGAPSVSYRTFASTLSGGRLTVAGGSAVLGAGAWAEACFRTTIN